MRTILSAVALATALGLAGASNTNAAPAAGTLREAADAASPLQQAQFSGRPVRHGIVKCYREFVIGPYHCHYFRNPLIWF